MAGTAQSSALGAIAWEAEDSFADAADDTITTRMQIRDDQIDLSGLVRPMVPAGGVFPRLNEADIDRVGAFGIGTFSTTFDLAGHGSTAAGALTETDLAKLLAHAVGNSAWTQIGGALTAGTNDTNTLTSTNVTGLVGGLVRVGALGDTRAEGQASVLQAEAADVFELDVDLPGSPTTADSLKAMGMIYPVSSVASGGILTSSGATSNNTLRFQLLTANQIVVARGCACTGISISGLNPGEMPTITLEWSCVQWEFLAGTFPPSEATNAKVPVPTANGSVFFNTVGTTTRVTDTPLETSISIGQGMVPVFGPGGENSGQNVVGWRRVPAETTLSLTFESQANTATPTFFLASTPSAARHILITGNTNDGASWALYLPRAIQRNNPQQGSTAELNTVTVEFLAATHTVTTSELTLSAWRLGLA